MVDGTEYGEVRQYGNFSFARIYESGHEVPYYQRTSPGPLPFQGLPPLSLCLCACGTHTNATTAQAALAYFNRTLYHYNIATGEDMVTANLTTSGPANATHTNSFVPLTSSYVPQFPSPIYPATMTSGY